MALFSNKKAIRQAKEAAGQQQRAMILGLQAADDVKARNIAAEETKANIFMSMGQPGTFGPGATGTTFGSGGTGAGGEGGGVNYQLYDPNVAKNQDFKKLATYGGKDLFTGTREGIIDPAGYTNALSQSIPFQIQSQQVAESQQLLNQEGPAWDLLENSTLGQIHEGAALQLRDTLRELKNKFAKGGTARRAAANEFNTILAQERAMRTRVSETWQANLRLHSYVRQNADRVAQGTSRFIDNLPGLNDSYRGAMMETAKLHIFAAENAAKFAGDAYDIRASQQAVNFGTKLLEGVIMAAASSAISGVAGAGGNYIASIGGTGLDAQGKKEDFTSGLGRFTNVLGGTLTDFGGQFSGGLAGVQYSDAQKEAVDRAEGNAPTREADDYLGTKYDSTNLFRRAGQPND